MRHEHVTPGNVVKPEIQTWMPQNASAAPKRVHSVAMGVIGANNASAAGMVDPNAQAGSGASSARAPPKKRQVGRR